MSIPKILHQMWIGPIDPPINYRSIKDELKQELILAVLHPTRFLYYLKQGYNICDDTYENQWTTNRKILFHTIHTEPHDDSIIQMYLN